MTRRSFIIVLFAAIILIIVAIYLAMYAPRGEGTLLGRITIGPISPLCTEGMSMQSSWYSNEVIITPQFGSPIHVPVNWTILNGCELSGSFQVALAPGIYGVSISSCLSEQNRVFGCSSLPKTVMLSANSITQVEISIDTGIR